MKIDVYIKRKGFYSTGIYDSVLNTIVVKKGSTINKSVAPKFEMHKYSIDRDDLIKNRVISDYTFTQDYEFDSPSKASSIVLGSNSNGRKYWLYDFGLNLNGFLKEMFGRNKRHRIDEVDIIIELNKLSDIEAQKRVKEIEKKIVERAYQDTNDKDSLINDINTLKEQSKKIIEEKHTLNATLKLVEKLWHENEKIKK